MAVGHYVWESGGGHLYFIYMIYICIIVIDI